MEVYNFVVKKTLRVYVEVTSLWSFGAFMTARYGTWHAIYQSLMFTELGQFAAWLPARAIAY